MDVSTVEFYEEVKELANGVRENADRNSKRISDYVEQTRQTNYTTLKDVFLVKEDKVDLIAKINETKVDLIDRINRNFNILIGTLLTVGGILIVLAINILNKLS